MSDAPDRDAGGGTLRGALSRLADALLGLMRTRLELASLEYSEERGRVGHQLALLLAGIGCLLFAMLFAAAGVIVYFWDSYRLAAIVAVMLFFAVAGAVLLWRRMELSHAAPAPFATTLAELEKDRAAISRTVHAPPPS
jgi:uncharacterized membrane protein YqjE